MATRICPARMYAISRVDQERSQSLFCHCVKESYIALRAEVYVCLFTGYEPVGPRTDSR
jgi:hypothetical protein